MIRARTLPLGRRPTAAGTGAALVAGAGCLALLARETVPWVLSADPGPLRPARVAAAMAGDVAPGIAAAVDLAAAVLLVPLAWALVLRPMLAAMFPGLPASAAGALFGVALWAGGLAVLAAATGGYPPALVLGDAARASLSSHLAYGLVLGAATARLPGRRP